VGFTNGVDEVVLVTGGIASVAGFFFTDDVGGMGAYADGALVSLTAGVIGTVADDRAAGLGLVVFSPNSFFQNGIGFGEDALAGVLVGVERCAAGMGEAGSDF